MARDQRGFVDTQDNQKSYNEKYVDNDSGPYVGVVKVTSDPLKMGRLGVNIPALSNTMNPSPAQVIWCHYLSPFYGGKPESAVSSTDPESYRENQTSYGFWAVPPDIDTEVLVIFAKGENNENSAYWIGCIQKPKVNQQIPGFASTTRVPTSTARESARTGQTFYGTDFLPSGDINRNFQKSGRTLSNADSLDLPLNDILADQLVKEGLIQDSVRGTTSSSANRESPSKVFGINTPGPVSQDSRAKNIGLGGTVVRPDRDLGQSIVMDDGDINGNNQLTRFRTASGHQLLMHDTEGVVYLANGSGKAFIEMAADGTISVYSEAGINLRSSGDFNLHSETNINFHAKGTINFTSENHLALNAEGYLFAMGEKGILSSSQKGAVRHYGRDGISSYTNGTQLHGAAGRIDLAGSQVHFNSVGASELWGPKWLKADAIGIRVTEGLIDIDPVTPIDNGRINKTDNKTTVSDFVTHEPYDRQSSTARKKKYIDEAMAEIKKSSPELSATELKVIKSELLKQKNISAVANKLSKVVKLNDNIKLPIKDLNKLVTKANDIKRLIEDPKGAAMNFIHGQIASIKTQALGFIKKQFKL
jgi:hypothetical protein